MKIQLQPHKKAYIERSDRPSLKGQPLRVSVGISSAYYAELERYINRLIRDTRIALSELRELDTAEDSAMDASIASQARIVMNALQRKFEGIFARVAMPISKRMVERTDKNAYSTLKTSIKDMGAAFTLNPDALTGDLADVINASTVASANLIKQNLPAKFLDQIQGDVMRSIQTGSNLSADLDKYGVSVKNWAKNVAMDQTRKTYSAINRSRMQSIGLDEFEWIHSGGSQHPRVYHRDELNGKIFKISKPPIIDKKTGERGLPGDAPYCRCIMRPTFRFTDETDNEDKDKAT